jgi:hypothetical protein
LPDFFENPASPVHSCLKFSTVLGTTSLKSSITTLPSGVATIETSKKTFGLVEASPLVGESPFSCLISPQEAILTYERGLSFVSLGDLSILSTISLPLMTLPKTTCFPSNHVVFAVVMKNYEPFVFLPAFAIDN